MIDAARDPVAERCNLLANDYGHWEKTKDLVDQLIDQLPR